MLEDLLREIRAGGTLETRVLATRLGTSPEIVAAMLEHLDRLGLIRPYAECTEVCQSCSLSDTCSRPTTTRLWQSSSTGPHKG